VSAPPHVPSDRFRGWLAAALLAGLTLIAYLPSLGNGFIWYDDIALTQNPMIRSADGLRQYWFTTQPPDYWPMTATTLWAEWRLWGMDASGYHATNLALHIAEVLLLWGILRRLSVPGAYLGALLFALHPVNVESVAWITQRKNMMAMLFYLISIRCFLQTKWAASEERCRTDKWYWLSLAAFVFAMLSKGSVALLPLVLAGMIAWRGRIALKDCVRLAPFFFVAGVLTLVNIWFQGHHLVMAEAIRSAGFGERVLGAGAAVWFYVGKAFLPIGLSFFYPLWQVRPEALLWWLPLLAAIGLTVFLWLMAGLHRATEWDARDKARLPGDGGEGRPARPDRRLWRGALFAWGYFCVALIPVMGFTDVYFMKFSLVADHYEHLALIGATTLAGAGWAALDSRRLKHFLAAAAVVVLGILTWLQCGTYRDAETLFRATLAANPDAWLAHENLGVILGDKRQIPEAMAHLEEALRLKPDFADAHSNLGALLVGQGRFAEGVAHYEAAVRSDPGLFVAHLNLGSLLLHEGRFEEARGELQAAVRLKPGFPEAHGLLGRALLQLGRVPEAVGEFETALRLKPDYPEARAQLDAALRALNR
jgi:protein O-mannosyl-transferase